MAKAAVAGSGLTGLARSTPAKDTRLELIGANKARSPKLSDEVWRHAELSLREVEVLSSAPPLGCFQDNPSPSNRGSGGFPTAFVATYGNGGPVLGFNAEYDALPGLLQKPGVTTHDPLMIHHYEAYRTLLTARRTPGRPQRTRAPEGTAAAIAVRTRPRAHGLATVEALFPGSWRRSSSIRRAPLIKAGIHEQARRAFLGRHRYNITVPF